MDDQNFRKILSACDPLDFACTRRVSESLGLNEWAKRMGWRNETLAETRARKAANAEDAAYGTNEAAAARAIAQEAQRAQAARNAQARAAAARANRDRRNEERAETEELQRQRPGYDATIEYVLRLPYLYPFRNNQQYLIATRYIQDKFLNSSAALPLNIEIATLAGLTNDIYQHLRQVPQHGTMNYLAGSRRVIDRIRDIHTQLVDLARQQAEQAAQMAQEAQRAQWDAAQAQAARAARVEEERYAARIAAASAAAAAPSTMYRRRKGSFGGSKKKTRKAKKTRKIRR